MKIVCISDTHDMHNNIVLPEGDMIIHAGDFTGWGAPHQTANFVEWYTCLDYKYKILIAGNHDKLCALSPSLFSALLEDTSITYLQDSGIEIEGIYIHGSPWTPEFHPENWVFNTPRKHVKTKQIWKQIPLHTDVLVVHGPPYGFRDVCPDMYSYNPWTGFHDRYVSVGCELLAERLEYIKPKYVVCGHIHESYGLEETPYGTTIVNAAICNGKYKPDNLPIVIEI